MEDGLHGAFGHGDAVGTQGESRRPPVVPQLVVRNIDDDSLRKEMCEALDMFKNLNSS